MTKSKTSQLAALLVDKTQPANLAPQAEPQGAKGTRAGKVTIAGFFPPEVRSSLRMIQAQQPTRTTQDLLGEALNLLFERYNVPATAPREFIDKLDV